MNWIYFVKQKVRVATVLVIVFGLVLIVNRVDKNHFSELQSSFTSLYQDRLVAESYIYQLFGLLVQKWALIDKEDDAKEEIQQKLQLLNNSVTLIVADYAETHLTENEALLFTELQHDLSRLEMLEDKYYNRTSVSHLKQLDVQHRALTSILDRLSEIQLIETKNIVERSNQIIASSNMISQLEISLLIVAGLIAQALLFASKSETPRLSQHHHLN